MISADRARDRYPRRARKFWSPPDPRTHLQRFEDQVALLVGRRIRQQRIFMGQRQIDLAHATGLTQPTISRIERGQRPPTVPELIRIAVQLNRPPEMFFDPPEPEQPIAWERRHHMPTTPRRLHDAAMREEFPWDDTAYD